MMITFIAQRIEEARDISLERGIAKYKAYFVNTKIYKRYRADVDAILVQDGYEDCIVEG